MLVEWQQVKLADLVPASVQQLAGLKTVLSGVVSVESTVLGGLSTGLGAVVPAVSAAVDPVQVAATQLLSLVETILNDVVNTGVYFLPIPPLEGTPLTFANRITAALLNQRDSRRPFFAMPSTMAAIGGFAFAPDNAVVDAAFASIQSGFISNVEVQRALGLRAMDKIAGTAESYYANLLAGTARNLKNSPWITEKISDLVPGFEPLVRQVQGIVSGLRNSVSVSAIDNYKRFISRYLANLNGVIASLDATLKFISGSLDNTPLRMFTIPPQAIGTAELVSGLPPAFDSKLNPTLVDVMSPAYFTGVILVMGSLESAAVVQAEYDTIRTLFGI